MAEDPSTRELVIQLQTGNLDALGLLYDRYHKMVYRTALAITGESEAASDLLQDVFLRLHRYADRVDPDRPLKPWLYRVTANLSCTWAKRRRWFRSLEDIAEWLGGDTRNSPHTLAEKADEWRQVEKAMMALPLSQRTVIVMYYVNGLSLQEIAQTMEIPVGTVKSRLFYGRRLLKSHMDSGEGILPEVRYEFT